MFILWFIVIVHRLASCFYFLVTMFMKDCLNLTTLYDCFQL